MLPVVRRAWPDLVHLEEVELVTFQRPVGPGDVVTDSVTRAGVQVRFTVDGADGRKAAGALRIGTSLLNGAQFTMGAVNQFRSMASSGRSNPFAGGTTQLAYGSGLNLMK